jgi:hypothetical protein
LSSLSGEVGNLGSELVDGEGLDGEFAQLGVEEAGLERAENDVASTFGASSTGSTDSVGVLLAVARDTELDDSRRAWVVDSSSGDVRGDEDRRLNLSLVLDRSRCSIFEWIS